MGWGLQPGPGLPLRSARGRKARVVLSVYLLGSPAEPPAHSVAGKQPAVRARVKARGGGEGWGRDKHSRGKAPAPHCSAQNNSPGPAATRETLQKEPRGMGDHRLFHSPLEHPLAHQHPHLQHPLHRQLVSGHRSGPSRVGVSPKRTSVQLTDPAQPPQATWPFPARHPTPGCCRAPASPPGGVQLPGALPASRWPHSLPASHRLSLDLPCGLATPCGSFTQPLPLICRPPQEPATAGLVSANYCSDRDQLGANCPLTGQAEPHSLQRVTSL